MISLSRNVETLQQYNDLSTWSTMDSLELRAPKRRKVYRKRPTSDDDNSDTSTHDVAPAVAAEYGEGVDGAKEELQSVADILRKRQASKRGRTGIRFNNDRGITSGSASAEHEDATESGRNAETSVIDTSRGRFTHETGHRVDDGSDKHM